VARCRAGYVREGFNLTAPAEDLPHAGHGVMRAGAEAGVGSGGQAFGGASVRFALHDLLDPRTGYPEGAQIEMLDFRFRYSGDTRSLWLEDFTLFQVVSMTPFTDFNQKISWKAKMGSQTVRDGSCDHCLAGYIEGGGGLTAPLPGRMQAFFSADFEAALAPGFKSIPGQSLLRLGAGPSLGVRIPFTSRLIGLLSANYRYRWLTRVSEATYAAAELRWGVGKNLAANLRVNRYPDGWENALGIYYYF
jgi:hypothetical protein